MKAVDRFHWNYYADPNSGCWIWGGGASFRKGKLKSCHFTVGNKQHVTSRYSFELFAGEIPEDMILKNTCGNEYCVNPRHFRLTFQAETAMIAQKYWDISKSKHTRFKKKYTNQCANGHAYPENYNEKYKTCVICRRKRHQDYKKKQRAKGNKKV